MLSLASRFFRWVLAKFTTAVLIVGLGVAACAVWVYLKDNVDFDEWRQDTLRAINGERAREQAALADVRTRLDAISAQIAQEQQRLRQTDKVIATLEDLNSTWDRFFGNREQQRANDARRASLAAERTATIAKIATLQQDFTHATWERDGLEVALGKLDARFHDIEAKRSKVVHYLSLVWNYEVGRGRWRLPIKAWVGVVIGLYFFGPTVGKLVLFFGVAPWIVRGRPVRLAAELAVMPEMGESGVVAEILLQPGDRLWVKEKFLQASDEGLRRKTRYLLDWRLPLTCVATGLIELIEMANTRGAAVAPPAGAGASFPMGEQHVTLSNQADPHSELAVVTLPEGSSIVLRPSFLAGVVTAEGRRLHIRRRWQLFRWQAWVTLQFRFFEFVGPCRLVVAGSRGIRVENLAAREGPGLPARRTNQDATVGFTPNLDYRPVRAETFWSYYRGMNPLFDDLFAGRGMFLCQQVASEGDAKQARKFWATVWGGVMKVFGL